MNALLTTLLLAASGIVINILVQMIFIYFTARKIPEIHFSWNRFDFFYGEEINEEQIGWSYFLGMVGGFIPLIISTNFISIGIYTIYVCLQYLMLYMNFDGVVKLGE